ncbi:MAG: purine-binding chemotaxis protein CheW [Proteobacteria bacterium]|nr:purine-binding chemotaxis protein CheW [Pseudomonadota bacterium]
MQEIASHFVHKNSIDVHQEFKAQFIVFRIETQEYGIPITSVKEIKGWSPTTTLPHSPPYMRGVVNLRGIIVPILDLRSRFGMGLTEVSPTHVVMIIHLENRTVGLLVDAVSDILTLFLKILNLFLSFLKTQRIVLSKGLCKWTREW